MKTLVITAHPSTKGFTHKIAQRYQSAQQAVGGDVRVIDLYRDMDYRQDFLSFEDAKGSWSGQDVRDRIQSDISWADELVFVCPMWWSGMPAIMKNFLDNNFTAGFAFTYENGRPKGLLSEKTVRLFMTADGPKVMYAVIKPLLWILMSKVIFGFCGMKMMSFDIFADMVGRKSRGDSPDDILSIVVQRAQK